MIQYTRPLVMKTGFKVPATAYAIPSALQEFPNGNTFCRDKIDLTYFEKARIEVDSAGSQGTFAVQYSHDLLHWEYLDGIDGPKYTINATDCTNHKWYTIHSNARADVFLRVVTVNGPASGSVQPEIWMYLSNNLATGFCLQPQLYIDFAGGAPLQCPNVGPGDTNFGGGLYLHRNRVPMSSMREARIVAYVHVAANSGCAMKAQYTTNDSFTPTYIDLGPSINIDATGLIVGPWTTLPGGATSVTAAGIRLLITGGDGAADPEFGSVSLQFRSVAEDAYANTECGPPLAAVSCPLECGTTPGVVSPQAKGKRNAVLVEVEIAKEFSKLPPRNPPSFTWTQDGTYTNLYWAPCNIVFGNIRRQIVSVAVTHNDAFVGYEKMGSLAKANATDGSWIADPIAQKLYVNPNSGVVLNESIVIAFWKYFAGNYQKLLNREVYQARLMTGSDIEFSAGGSDEYFSSQEFSAGDVEILNGDGSFDSALYDYEWRGGRITTLIAQEDPDSPASYSSYRKVRGGMIGAVTRTDQKVTLSLISGMARMDTPALKEFVIAASDSDYPELPVYSTAPLENIGAFISMFFGRIDAVGDADVVAARSLPCLCVGIGTEKPKGSGMYVSRKYKVVMPITNLETGEVHSIASGYKVFKNGKRVDSSKYSLSENNTLITFSATYKVEGDAQITAAISGYKDDAAGTFTGTANAVIEKPWDVAHFLLVTRARIPTAELDLAMFTGPGVTKQGIVGAIIAPAWATDVNVPIIETGGADVKRKMQKVPFREGSTSVTEVVNRLAIGWGAVLQQRADGLFTHSQISDDIEASDPALYRYEVDELAEKWSLDTAVSSVIVLGNQNPNSGELSRQASKRIYSWGGSNVRDRYLEALTGKPRPVEITTYLKANADLKLLANEMFRHFKRGVIELSGNDLRGKVIDNLVGEKVLVRADRQIGGQSRDRIRERPFWNQNITKNFSATRVNLEKLIQVCNDKLGS